MRLYCGASSLVVRMPWPLFCSARQDFTIETEARLRLRFESGSVQVARWDVEPVNQNVIRVQRKYAPQRKG